MSALFDGVRLALLALMRRPAYALASIALLGASSAVLLAMLVVLDAMVVRPPSARALEELVFVGNSEAAGLLSRPDYLDLRDRARSFSGLFAYDRPERVELVTDTTLQTAVSLAVSANFFSTLAIDLQSGRDFVEADERDGAERVALLGQELSERLSLGVGASFDLNGRRFRVVGVVPRGYQGLDRSLQPELFIPLTQALAYRVEWSTWNRGYAWVRVGGRLRPGTTLDVARQELERLYAALDAEHPETVGARDIQLQTFVSLRLAVDARARTLLLLSFAVATLFVLTFINFLTSSLLRLFSRRREVALRIALGATNGNIASWLLLELLFVVVLGLAFGRALTAALLAALTRDPTTAQLFEASGVHVDARSLGIVFGGSLLATAIVWLFVARQARFRELLVVIKDAPSSPGRRSGFVPLLGAQLALALCLVTLSIAFIDTLRDVISRPLQFRTDHVLALRADVRKLGSFDDRTRSNAFYSQALERMHDVQGVLAVSVSDALPLQPARRTGIWVGDLDPRRNTEQLHSWFTFISSGYFDALGIRVLAGRTVDAGEVARAEYVAVINRAMALRFWGGEEQALGQTFRPWDGGEQTRIVGVVVDPPTSWDDNVALHFYLPFTTTTNPKLLLSAYVTDESEATVAGLDSALSGMWRDPADRRFLPMRAYIGSSRHDLETAARIASWLALFGVLVVASGLYFSSAFAAAQTLRESALRMALGASPFDILREHVAHYRWALVGGLLAGVLLVLSSQPILKVLQVPLLSPDPSYVALATFLLALTALAGLCAPLWRLRGLDVIRTLQPD